MRSPSRTRVQPVVALAVRAALDGRVRTIAFAYLFALYSFVQPYGYRHAYPHLSDRLSFARSFASNVGLHLLYGQPHDVVSVNGYTAWRVGGTLAIAAALYGLFAAVRAQRAEEDAGRAEVVLAGPVSRGSLNLAGLAAVGMGTLTLWVAEFAGFVTAGVPAGGAAYLALATTSVIPVCAGVGAVAGQLTPTRRVALEVGGGAVALLLLLRAVADTTNGLGWVRWLTPLGWAEELRPFAGARPVVLLLPVAVTLVLVAGASRLAASRDIGTGLLPARDTAEPRLQLLRSPLTQALRSNRGDIVIWAICLTGFGFILGVVSNAVSPADVSANMQRQIAKLGVGSITTPTGYLGFVFLILVVAVSLFACSQVSAARQEEADQRLETLLALPLSRTRWLSSRAVLATGTAAALALAAGLATWAGVVTAGTHVSLLRLLEAAANVLPTAVLFLGLALLAYALLPRVSSGLGYGLVAVAFLWQLVAAILNAPEWLRDATPFAHVALLPAQPFRTEAAVVMTAIGIAAALISLTAFRHRDLTSV
jgi:ABC-2 type transport system permease protein